jgi:hypothetical protein
MNVIHILVVLSAPSFLLGFNGSVSQDLRRKKAFLVRKHLKRLKKVEGAIKLVGGGPSSKVITECNKFVK